MAESLDMRADDAESAVIYGIWISNSEPREAQKAPEYCQGDVSLLELLELSCRCAFGSLISLLISPNSVNVLPNPYIPLEISPHRRHSSFGFCTLVSLWPVGEYLVPLVENKPTNKQKQKHAWR